jgi:transcriptional regulator with XRE-family HTH domain
MSAPKPPHNDDAERQRLGERLRQAREYLGLKQKDVADYLGIPRTALGDIESGQRRVDAIELNRLAKLYKQPVAYFTGEDAAGAELPAGIAHLARQAAELSDKDRDELRRFVAYLQNRSQAGNG